MIDDSAIIKDSSIGEDVNIYFHAHLEKSEIGSHVSVGDFSRMPSGSHSGDLVGTAFRLGVVQRLFCLSIDRRDVLGRVSGSQTYKIVIAKIIFHIATVSA